MNCQCIATGSQLSYISKSIVFKYESKISNIYLHKTAFLRQKSFVESNLYNIGTDNLIADLNDQGASHCNYKVATTKHNRIKLET